MVERDGGRVVVQPVGRRQQAGNAERLPDPVEAAATGRRQVVLRQHVAPGGGEGLRFRGQDPEQARAVAEQRGEAPFVRSRALPGAGHRVFAHRKQHEPGIVRQ